MTHSHILFEMVSTYPFQSILNETIVRSHNCVKFQLLFRICANIISVFRYRNMIMVHKKKHRLNKDNVLNFKLMALICKFYRFREIALHFMFMLWIHCFQYCIMHINIYISSCDVLCCAVHYVSPFILSFFSILFGPLVVMAPVWLFSLTKIWLKLDAHCVARPSCVRIELCQN